MGISVLGGRCGDDALRQYILHLLFDAAHFVFSSRYLFVRMISPLHAGRASRCSIYRNVDMRSTRARLPISCCSAGIDLFIVSAES